MNRHSPLQFAYGYLARQKIKLLLAIFWSVVFVLVPMQIPVLTGALIDGMNGKPVRLYSFVLSDQPPQRILQYALIGLSLIAATYGVSAYLRKTAIAKVSRHFVAELRKSLIRKLEALSVDVHARYGSGELLNRVILDTQSMRQFIEAVCIRTITNAVRVVYPVCMLLAIDPFLALIALSVLPLQWIVTSRFQRKLHQASARMRTGQAGLTAIVKEHLDGIETIQTLGAEPASFGKISTYAEELERHQLRTNTYAALSTGSVWTFTNVGYALTWWQGGVKVLEGEMTIGTLIVFTAFVAFIYDPSRRFTNVLNVYKSGVVAMERIQELLDAPSSIRESANAKPLQIVKGNIELQNVSFGYTRQRVFTGVSVQIPGRALTGIVGRSGSGKSSLVKLIPRLYDPSAGRILIDGQDIQQATLESLRHHVAVVPQMPMMFSGTVSENLRLAKPTATEREIEEACHAADALPFILKLGNGFHTRLGQGGVNVSGGEIQRIALARALLKKPKILLLDEPTSALDAESESAIMATLTRLKQGMTIVFVGHHLQALRAADRIIVIEDGKVVEHGAPDELLSLPRGYNGLYSRSNGKAEQVTLSGEE